MNINAIHAKPSRNSHAHTVRYEMYEEVVTPWPHGDRVGWGWCSRCYRGGISKPWVGFNIFYPLCCMYLLSADGNPQNRDIAHRTMAPHLSCLSTGQACLGGPAIPSAQPPPDKVHLWCCFYSRTIVGRLRSPGLRPEALESLGH